jgi:GTPase SAR1 family protein
MNFFKGATGAIIVFDLTNEKSFENLKFWIRQLRLHADENIQKILVGNKCDLED